MSVFKTFESPYLYVVHELYTGHIEDIIAAFDNEEKANEFANEYQKKDSAVNVVIGKFKRNGKRIFD